MSTALADARAAGITFRLEPGGRLQLDGPRRAAPIARRLLADPEACAELRALLRLRHARRPHDCSCLGRVFWRRLDLPRSPWVCGTCHKWPGHPRDIETWTFAK